MKFEEIHTQRMVLRQADPNSIAYVHDNFSDKEIADFYGFTDHAALEKEKEKFNNGLHTFNKSFLYFHLILKETNKVIGWCGYHTWYVDHDRAEIGYGLTFESDKRKGLMTEALSAVLDHGFNKMDLHRVEAFIGEDNFASLQLVDKFNFKKEGVLKEHYLKDGVYEDSLVYGLLKKDHGLA